jgi:hypothetical protein
LFKVIIWISWSYDHATHNNKIDNELWKAKIGLIRVWYNENLFQGISIDKNPHLMNTNFQMRSIKKTSRNQLIFYKSI